MTLVAKMMASRSTKSGMKVKGTPLTIVSLVSGNNKSNHPH